MYGRQNEYGALYTWPTYTAVSEGMFLLTSNAESVAAFCNKKTGCILSVSWPKVRPSLTRADSSANEMLLYEDVSHDQAIGHAKMK